MKRLRFLLFLVALVTFMPPVYAMDLKNGKEVLQGQWLEECDIDDADIDDSTIDNSVIGGTTPSTGAFTDLSSTGTFDCDRYETVWIPVGDMASTATNGATFGSYEYPTNDINIDYYAFDSSVTEYLEFDYTMPGGWDTTSLKMKFEWMGPSGCTVSDTVTIGVAAVTRNNGEANDAAVGTYVDIQDTVLADADDEVHRTDATGTITPAGTPTAGGTIHFKIRRTTTDAAMAEDLWLARAGINYKITSAEPAF